ncbi:MAG: hypothetical protein NT013_05925 [Planctomycetia bacterium]|nr:hypothetical protein [Planctomycetia bacterium]
MANFFSQWSVILWLALLACDVAAAQEVPVRESVDAATAPVAIPAKPATPPPTPLELQPYRVHITVAFDDEPSLSPHFRKEVLGELTEWIDRTYAEMWQTSVEENQWLAPTSIDGLSRLTWTQIEAQLGKMEKDKELDKVFVVCVSSHGGVLRLSAREWDRLTQQLSVRHDRLVSDRRATASELGIVIRDLFHPIVMIDGLEGKSAKVRVRAGEFPPGDPSAEQLSSGAFFQPFFRFYNKQRELQQIQQVPWTYMSVDSAERSHGLCTIHTGLRVTLGKNTKRSESWAIGIRPSFSETRVRMTPHNNPTKPLTGYQVNVFERRTTMPVPNAAAAADAVKKDAALPDVKSDASKPSEAAAEQDKKPAASQPTQELVKLHELVTDRRGQVVVPADRKSPLIWLYVSSGGNMLGRFPYMPGTSQAITAELPDDTLRLQLESRLEMLRAELIDTIARRALLIARTKGAARAQEWDKYAEALRDMDRLSDAKFFNAQLETIKVNTAKKAQERKDKGLERKIAKLCADSSELIERHLNAEKLKEQREELAELRQADAEAAAAEKAKPRTAVPTKSPSGTAP